MSAFYDTFCVSAFVCYSNLQKFYSTCEVRINVTSLCLHNNDKGLVICLYVFSFMSKELIHPTLFTPQL